MKKMTKDEDLESRYQYLEQAFIIRGYRKIYDATIDEIQATNEKLQQLANEIAELKKR